MTPAPPTRTHQTKGSPRGARSRTTAVLAGLAVAALALTACDAGQASETSIATTPRAADATTPAGELTTTPTASAAPSVPASTGQVTSPGASPRSASSGSSTTPKAAPSAPRTKAPLVRPTTAPTKPTAATGPRITVSRTNGLDPDKATITVTGKGFDTSKGIYVALCVKPAKGQAPNPCGGGADTTGSTSSSSWVSSNPPPYGSGLAIRYGSGGTFRVTLVVSSMIGSLDCRTKSCVVATRNDHTRGSDRSQDVLVPVTFARS